MNKFKEGDIVVKDGFTYVCRIVGETESYFEHRWFAGLFKTPNIKYGAAGCGGHPDHSCTKNLILFSDRCRLQKSKSNSKDYCTHGSNYSVIGNTNGCGTTMFNMAILSNMYPDEYKNYVKFLYERDVETTKIVEAIKELKTKNKKVKK